MKQKGTTGRGQYIIGAKDKEGRQFFKGREPTIVYKSSKVGNGWDSKQEAMEAIMQYLDTLPPGDTFAWVATRDGKLA